MSKAIAEIAIGVAVVAAAFFAPGLSVALVAALATTGGGLVLTGIGTLLTKQQVGLGAGVRNPIQPQNVIYGDARIGGTVVFIEETGESDKYLHMVYVLACHPCYQISAILFDGKRIILAWDGALTTGNSFTPTQWTSSIATIARTNNIVTVTLSTPFVGLEDGDFVAITDVSDATMNGTFPVTVVNSSTFTFLSGGINATGSGGQAETTWPDYGDTVHAEVALGTQTSNPFPGLVAGDDTGSNGLWTSAHALRGKTAVYLRLKFGGEQYAAGMPTIAFVVRGKNDIYDPRTGTSGFTANAALCIADYLTNTTWGFKADYGTSVPTGPLITSANICDEAVTRASGVVEPRYTLNGSFQLTAKRGEILQNLLTSCAGRLTYTAGQFIIYPGAWVGPAGMFGKTITSATLSVVTSHLPGTGYTAFAQATTGNIAIIGGSGPGFIFDSGAWTKRTDTTPISGDPRGAHCLFGISGSTSGSATPADEFRIHEAWIDVTYFDGTAGVFRPTSTTILANGSGSISNEANAIDTDPDSYATVTRGLFAPLGDSPYLNLQGFALVSGDDGTGTGQSPVDIPAPLSLAAGPFQWKPKLGMRDLFNGVKATYISPSNGWQATDMPAYAQDENHGYESDANLAADGGDRRWLDIQLPFTNSVSMAQRIAKIELLRRRQQGAGTFVFNLAMFRLTALDVVSLDLSFFSWSGKLLEVTGHRFVPNNATTDSGSATTLHTELDVVETDSSIYDWDPSEELSVRGYNQALLPNPRNVAPPTGVAATSSSTTASVGADGSLSERVKITWTTPADGYVTQGGQIEVQYQVAGAASWTALGVYDGNVTSAYIPGVSDGVTYNVRVRSVNTAGYTSPWVTTTVTAAGGGPGSKEVWNEKPNGVSNGSNRVFTLMHAPNPVISLRLYRNGTLLRLGLDFSLSGNVITFIITPPNEATHGDWMRAHYKFDGSGTTSVYSVSGSLAGFSGAPPATVAVSGYGTVATGSGGSFTIPGLPAGTYTLTPSAPGYTFTPSSTTVTVTTSDVSGTSFTGSTSGSTSGTGGTGGTTAGGGSAPAQAAAAGFNTLNFFDDFATFDTSVWFPGIWYEPDYGAGQSWGVSGSVLDLNITSARWSGGGNYADTSILTISRNFATVKAWKYGYFEARMKWDVTNGAWPAFWLNGDYGPGGPAWMELDIFEGQGNDNQAYFGTLHTWPSHTQTSPNRFPLTVDFSQWHTYGCLWTTGLCKFYLDNVLIATVSTPSVGDTGPNLYMILSMQFGNDWSEGNTSGVSASSMNNYVDWVKVWK